MISFLPFALGLLGHTPDVSPDEAMRSLVEGNRRFVSQEMHHPHLGEPARRETAKAQHPIAAIVTCADSRVSPEFLFDQGLGDLFVVRSAGNTVDDDALASLEYAVDHLGVNLIVVMGHSKCGAVSAAVASATHADHEEGEPEFYVPRLIAKIQPAVRCCLGLQGDLLTNAIRANERMVSITIRKADGGLGRALQEGRLRVTGAVYDLTTNRVDFDSDAVPFALSQPHKTSLPKPSSTHSKATASGPKGHELAPGHP